MDFSDRNNINALVSAEDARLIKEIQEKVDYHENLRTEERHHSALCAFAVFIRTSQSSAETTETLKNVLDSKVPADKNPTVVRFSTETKEKSPLLARHLKAAINAVRRRSSFSQRKEYEPIPDDAKTIKRAIKLLMKKSTWFSDLSDASIGVYVHLMGKLSVYARQEDEDDEGKLYGILFGDRNACEHEIVKGFISDKNNQRIAIFLQNFDEARRLQRVEGWRERMDEPGVWGKEGAERVVMDLNFHPDDEAWIGKYFRDDE